MLLTRRRSNALLRKRRVRTADTPAESQEFPSRAPQPDRIRENTASYVSCAHERRPPYSEPGGLEIRSRHRRARPSCGLLSRCSSSSRCYLASGHSGQCLLKSPSRNANSYVVLETLWKRRCNETHRLLLRLHEHARRRTRFLHQRFKRGNVSNIRMSRPRPRHLRNEQQDLAIE